MAELIKKSHNRMAQIERVKVLVNEGHISQRLGDYAQHLVVLDQLSDEVKTYSSINDMDRVIGSLTAMKQKLDDIGAVLLADGKIESKDVSGIPCLANPNFKNIEKYKELYDFAQKKYDDAVIKYEQLISV